MAKIDPKFQKDVSAGMVTNVNENVVPKNSVRLGLNVDFDEEIGSAVSRLGTDIVNTQLESGKSILGLHNFRDVSGSNDTLLAVVNNSGDTNSVVTDVENDTVITGGSIWDSLTASKKVRMMTFLDTVLLVNGTDTPSSWTGSGNVVTTGGAYDLGNVPTSDPSLCIEYLSRVYLAGDSTNPDRIFYSSVPSVGGVISWTSGNGYVDLEPEDGGGTITAFGKVPGYLLIFKERSLHRWNFVNADPENLITIGTPSQESVIMAGGLCAFFSASSKEARGFYVTDGGRPQPISHDRVRNIKKWVDAIPQANESDVAGFATDRFFAWSIGDVTVDGIDYTNVVVRYNRKLDQWSVRSYPSEFKVFSSFVDSGVNKVVGGDDDGNVIEIDKADTFTDHPSSTPIHYKLQTQIEDFTFNQRKSLTQRIVARTKNARNAKVNIYTDLDEKFDLETIGTIDGHVTALKLPDSIQGNDFMFEFTGTVNGARAVFKEFEIPEIDISPNTYD